MSTATFTFNALIKLTMPFLPAFLTLLLTLTPRTLATPLSKRQFDYVSSALRAHNVHRANHSAADLVWDNELANSASIWANVCTFAHNT